MKRKSRIESFLEHTEKLNISGVRQRKIKMTVELDCESWMGDDIEPKTKEEWSEFFMKYLDLKSIIGSETENGQEIIALNRFSIDVTEVSTDR